ncbi:MAG: zinc ribbon domain-containing protein, partial [Candidatus Odinarchaeota archaeon]
MNNYKYCPKCGTLIDFKNANYCPQCKTSLYSPTITTIKNIKKRKRGWENYSKILSLIGSIIGLFSIFAPTGSIHLGGLYSWDMWIYGYNVTYDWEEGTEIFWTLNPELLAFSITSTIFIVIGNIMAIIGFVQLLKKKEYAYFLPGIGSVLLVGFILFYLIAYEIYFLIYMGESFWSFLPPSFGFYGQLIAAILMLLAFFFARKSAQYSEPLEKEVH